MRDDTSGLIAALESEAHSRAALEIALRRLEEMPEGAEKDELQCAVDRALKL